MRPEELDKKIREVVAAAVAATAVTVCIYTLLRTNKDLGMIHIYRLHILYCTIKLFHIVLYLSITKLI